MNEKYLQYVKIKKSKIHGKGIFVKNDTNSNSIIGVGIYYYINLVPIITKEFGSLINHSYNPNCKLRYNKNKQIYNVISKKNIYQNNEITLNYNDTPWFIKKAESYYK